MDVFKSGDRKRYIEYTINKYYKKEHEKKYINVLNEIKNFIISSNILDDKYNIGSYLLARIDGMPPLVFDY